jgi:broad specificity phosphatase PhoE
MTESVVSESDPERQVWLVRHGETEWTRSGRHTGRSDIPLTDLGRQQAETLAGRLAGLQFAVVLTSPRSRAAETARLAGFGDTVVVDPNLREWDYGAFEGRTTPEIRTEIPDWSIWTGPWRGGETLDDVAARADRVVERCLDPNIKGDVLLFAHGHFLRILAARWIGLPAYAGRSFALGTATVGILGWERETRAIETWNEACDRST